MQYGVVWLTFYIFINSKQHRFICIAHTLHKYFGDGHLVIIMEVYH